MSSLFLLLVRLVFRRYEQGKFFNISTASEILRIYVVRWAGCRNVVLQLFPSSHAAFIN